jgi:hypothetical protein
MIMVASNVASVPIFNPPDGVTEKIPDALAAAVLVDSPFNLIA